MKYKFLNHRIWHFIQVGRELGHDSIEFYRPVSTLANYKYRELTYELNALGYIVKDSTNPKGNSLAGLVTISNIQKVKVEGEK